MRLSVVIVNWNTGDLIRRCLESVYADLPSGETEVFVVDSASTDGSTHALQARFPQVNYIYSPHNIGFGPANEIYAHTPDDQCPVEHLTRAARFYATFPALFAAARR